MKRTLPLLFFFLLISCGMLQDSADLTPDDEKAIAEVIELVNFGKFESAYNKVNALIERKAVDSRVHFYYGFLIDKIQEEPGKALKHYSKALTLYAREGRDEPLLQALIHFYSSYTHTKSRNTDKARASLNSAMAQLEAMEKAGRLNDGIGYYMLAYCYDKHSKFDLSLNYYRKSIAYFEQRRLDYYYLPGAYYNIGVYYYNQSDFENAARYWKQAYLKEPEDSYFKSTYEEWYKIAKEAIE